MKNLETKPYLKIDIYTDRGYGFRLTSRVRKTGEIEIKTLCGKMRDGEFYTREHEHEGLSSSFRDFGKDAKGWLKECADSVREEFMADKEPVIMGAILGKDIKLETLFDFINNIEDIIKVSSLKIIQEDFKDGS